ncbi:MAG: substrate-binding domain-containing protein [Methanosarcinales archaeon]
MYALQRQGLILESSRRNFAKNGMVLIVPKNTTKNITFDKLKDPTIQRIAIGNPKSVPAGLDIMA